MQKINTDYKRETQTVMRLDCDKSFVYRSIHLDLNYEGIRLIFNALTIFRDVVTR